MNNKSSVSKRKLSSFAKSISRVHLDLQRTQETDAKSGFALNQWGTYWSSILIDQWLELNEHFCNVEDRDESLAARYSKAMFLLTLNRLDQAEDELNRIASVRSSAATSKGLAVVMARRGELAQAMQLAAQANEAPHAAFFRVSEEDLALEAELGKRFARGNQ